MCQCWLLAVKSVQRHPKHDFLEEVHGLLLAVSEMGREVSVLLFQDSTQEL